MNNIIPLKSLLLFFFVLLIITFVAEAEIVPGELAWRFPTGGRVDSSPAIDTDGTIYVGSWDNHVYAFYSEIVPEDSAKGTFPTGGHIDSSPAISQDGTIYVGSWDNYLYAINPDGTEKWKFLTDNLISSSPAIGVDGTIYIGSLDDYFYAINPDGTKKWSFLTAGGIDSSPAISLDGTIYIGSLDSYLYAINSDGTEKWRFRTGGLIFSSPAEDLDGNIYIASSDNYLYSLNPDGTERWRFLTGGSVESSPAIGIDGTIYIGSLDNYLYAINPDGTEQWKFLTGGAVTSTPAVGADRTVYFGSWDKYLYALNSDGSEKWKYLTEDQIHSSPVIAPDSTIYVGSRDNHIYSINGDSGGLSKSAWPMFRHDESHSGRREENVEISCSYEIDPLSQSFDSDGGEGVRITITTTDPSCAWSAVSNDTWIELTSETEGYGDGYVDFRVTENTDIYSRAGTMTIAEETFDVTQTGIAPPPSMPILVIPYLNRGDDYKSFIKISNTGFTTITLDVELMSDYGERKTIAGIAEITQDKTLIIYSDVLTENADLTGSAFAVRLLLRNGELDDVHGVSIMNTTSGQRVIPVYRADKENTSKPIKLITPYLNTSPDYNTFIKINNWSESSNAEVSVIVRTDDGQVYSGSLKDIERSSTNLYRASDIADSFGLTATTFSAEFEINGEADDIFAVVCQQAENGVRVIPVYKNKSTTASVFSYY